MKHYILLPLIALITACAGWPAAAQSTTRIPTTTLTLGQKSAVSKDLIFDIGLGNANPRMRGSATNSNIQFANDGVTFSTVPQAGIYAVTSTTTTPYTALSSDQLICMDATAGTKTINLPAIASNLGREYLLKKCDTSTNSVILDPNASELIEGASTLTMYAPGATYRIVATATQWEIISRKDSWWAEANITGANISGAVTAVSAYAEVTNAGLTMTPRTGSAPIAVMCATTNAATAPTTSTSTCSAGNESLGMNVNIPWPGWYEACVIFAHQMSGAGSNGAHIQITNELIQTPLNAQTLTQEGTERIQSSLTYEGGAASQIATFPQRTCGTFLFTAAGNFGWRIMEEVTVTAGSFSNLYMADAAAGNGQRDIKVTVRALQ